MRTGFAGKSKGNLGGGPTLSRSLNGHGGPVPAKLTQTAKEMGIVGKRPTHVVTTRCTCAALTHFPKWCETIRLWATSLDSPESLSMSRADFVRFASKVVLISPNLLVCHQ